MENYVAVIKTWLGSGSINLFGSPFSGKDTQAQRLAKLFNAPVIGGGDIIRNSSNERVKDIIARGRLAPTTDYLEMVLPYFQQKQFERKPLILSSVGRWHGEEEVITSAAEQSSHPIKAVIFLKLSEEEAQKRWKIAQHTHDRGNRADDATGVLKTRFNEFRKKTLPVIEFYQKKGLFIEVDGSQTPDEVTGKILDKLAAKAS